MPLYQYRCPECGDFDSQRRADHLPCDNHPEPLTAKRIFGFALKPIVHGHMNPTTGQYVSGDKAFKEQLKVMSNEATERTGVPHNYVPTDPRDMKASGVTEEGLKETYDRSDPEARKVLDKYI